MYYVVWNMREAHVPHNIIHLCAAKPREHPASAGEGSENQARSGETEGANDKFSHTKPVRSANHD